MKKLLLINPRNARPLMFEGQSIGVIGVGDAATTTVAALAPRDKFEVTIVDEQLAPVDPDIDADIVGLTGKYGQHLRMIELARHFRSRKIPVVIGGPHASLEPSWYRDECDVLVQGELEPIAERFFTDLHDGTCRNEYFGERAPLDDSPIPRWDLYPNERCLSGSLQVSRGCPFECEYCDVIQYVGRRQRYKQPEQVRSELAALYGAGYRHVFLADDNLTANRKKAKEALQTLINFNSSVPEPLVFSTQLSIDATKDEEMLDLLAEAQVFYPFVGIETTNEESMKGAKKHQNVGFDILERVERFARRGIMISSGMMLGFDQDDESIFQRQFDFAMASPVPIFQVTTLIAPAGTPLLDRLVRADRMRKGNIALPSIWATNFVPAHMTPDTLENGVRELFRELYAEDNFAKRTLRFLELAPAGNTPEPRTLRPPEQKLLMAIQRARLDDPAFGRLFTRLIVAASPGQYRSLMAALSVFLQAKYVLKCDDELRRAQSSPPPAATPPNET